MSETANVLAVAALLLLGMTVAIWAVRLRGPMLQRLDGSRQSNDRSAGFLMKILMAALLVSATGAIVAVAALLFS